MFDVAQAAFVTLSSGYHPLYLMAGVLLGLSVGIFPGLGGAAGIALVVPFIYGMDPNSALALMIGLLAVVSTGDTFTSVLLGIPGSAAGQATVVDGFPLAKKGQAARALSAAFMASLVGGVFGAILLSVFIQVARPLVLAFGSAELLMLSVLGLSIVSALAGKSIEKGLIAAGLGLLLGAVGGAPATGELRMTAGSPYLADGLSLVVLGLGLFAIPEILDLLSKGKAVAEKTNLGFGWGQGLRDAWRNRWMILRCSALGSLLGAIPGIGGTVIDWIAYAHAVQTTKDRSNFGKGEIRGVIAPESANNAKEGGALVPTLIFGIPGSGASAIFLGSLILVGIQPGVSMVNNDMETIYVIIWSLGLANILGAGLCVLIARPVARLTQIPFPYLAPFIISMICFAAFQASRRFEDIILLAAFGMLGLVMKRLGWPRPALLIGFVLSAGVERYLYQSMQFYGMGWFQRPIVLILIALTIASIVVGLRISKTFNAEQNGEKSQPRFEMAFIMAIVALIGFTIFDMVDRTFLGKVYPLGMAAIIAVALVVLVLRSRLWQQRAKEPMVNDDGPDTVVQVSVPILIGGFIGFVSLIFLAGFLPAMAVLFVVVLHFAARAPLILTLALTALGLAGIFLISNALNLRLPYGTLASYLT